MFTHHAVFSQLPLAALPVILPHTGAINVEAS